MMQIALITAVSENNVIGAKNGLPWHLPEELQYFRAKTRGKPIIMGRKTFESMGNKPLPNRYNIILTHTKDFIAPGCKVVASVHEALEAALPHLDSTNEVMIIGGAQIYQDFLPMAHKIYRTIVHQVCEGDTHFPIVDWPSWKLVSEEKRTGFTLQIFDKI